MKLDAIIVGAGFAGITAARELGKVGLRCLILEGRKRIGGRTWYNQHEGLPFELGGAAVHWLQPHVWAEITRYGLKLLPYTVETLEEIRLLSNERLHTVLPDEGYALITEAYTALYGAEPQPGRLFPIPYDPLQDTNWMAYASISLSDHVEGLGLSPIQHDLLTAILSTDMNAPIQNAALVEMLRLRALIGSDDFSKLAEVTGGFVIEGGTRALLEPMLEESRAALETGCTVTHIEQLVDRVRLQTSSGDCWEAGVIILTAPVNTWTNITFVPPMNPSRQRLTAERHAGMGFKCFVRIKGNRPGLLALAPAPYPFSMLTTHYCDSDSTWLVGFGPIAPTDLSVEWGQHALQPLLPEDIVTAVYGHNWSYDPLAGGTWASLKPGQANLLGALNQPDDRIFFASADTALGWRGYIDGAIESGIRTARQATQYLGA
jgi:monoamine oxidase